jgi:hypothetical protein
MKDSVDHASSSDPASGDWRDSADRARIDRRPERNRRIGVMRSRICVFGHLLETVLSSV